MLHALETSGCFQSVKVKKFESNSQPCSYGHSHSSCCFQSVKVKKFESNSQPILSHCLSLRSCFQSVKVKKFESNSQRSAILCHSLYCWFQSSKDKRNTFIRYFSRVFFPESVFGYVPVFPFRLTPLENPLPPEDADEVNRFYVVVPAPARSRIVHLRLPYVFIVIPSGECRLKTKDLHGSPGRFFRFPWSE